MLACENVVCGYGPFKKNSSSSEKACIGKHVKVSHRRSVCKSISSVCKSISSVCKSISSVCKSISSVCKSISSAMNFVLCKKNLLSGKNIGNEFFGAQKCKL